MRGNFFCGLSRDVGSGLGVFFIDKLLQKLGFWVVLAMGVAVGKGQVGLPPTPKELSNATVVVYNLNWAGAEELAKFYAQVRGVPEENVIALDCPTEEEISREEFVGRIQGPLRAELLRRGMWLMREKQVVGTNLRYMVLVRGMPLKVRSALAAPAPGEVRDPIQDRDEASVDSELTVLGVENAWKGVLRNPYYQGQEEATRTKVIPPAMFLVCRLDGAEEDVLRARVMEGMRAEARGLWGWGVVDLRGIVTGPYLQGDDWLRKCLAGLRRNGVPVLSDLQEPTLPDGFPLRDVALYVGWYSEQVCGPFADPLTTFTPGAVAVHIHSFSASTLREPLGWVAPLVRAGVAATAGNVYEPYLSFSLNLDLFVERLLLGWPLADAAWAATPALSWMNVVVGDPLYRPFAVWHRTQARRIAPGNEWERIRQAVVERGGNWDQAVTPLIALSKVLYNPIPAQAVGLWFWENARNSEAVEQFMRAMEYAREPWQQVQIGWYLVKALDGAKRRHEAIRLLQEWLKLSLPPNQTQLLRTELERLNPSPKTDLKRN